MELASALILDGGRQPQLLKDEVIYKLQADIDLYDRDEKSARKRGTAVLTSHRIGWMDASRTDCIQWPLSHVVRTEVEEAGFFAGSQKVVVHLATVRREEHGQASAYPSLAPSSSGPSVAGHVKLSFKAGGRDAFAEDLRKAASRRSWVTADDNIVGSAAKRGRADIAGAWGAAGGPTALPGSLAPPGGHSAPTQKVGLALIKEFEEARAQAGRILATTAFSDLDELVKHGKRVADLAEKYARELSSAAASAVGSGSPPLPSPVAGGGVPSAGVDAESEAAGSILTGLGFVAPVTRDVAGSLFVQEVARQVAGFIGPALARVGGMLPLTDVYMAYNRARGTDPVSPEDLLAALRLVGPAAPHGLGLGLHVASLEGGLLVLQLDSFSPREMQKKLVAMLASSPFLTAHSVSRTLRIPLAVAEHHVAAAEGAGVLARDDSINGLRYYENLFLVQKAG